jgi:hypothetical protein
LCIALVDSRRGRAQPWPEHARQAAPHCYCLGHVCRDLGRQRCAQSCLQSCAAAGGTAMDSCGRAAARFGGFGRCCVLCAVSVRRWGNGVTPGVNSGPSPGPVRQQALSRPTLTQNHSSALHPHNPLRIARRLPCLRFPSLPLAALGAQSHFTCHPIHPFFAFAFASCCRPLGYPICTPASQSCPPTKR